MRFLRFIFFLVPHYNTPTVSVPRSFAMVLAVALLTSCAAPLWPRYQIQKQHFDLSYSSNPPSRISFTATYRLQNTGDRALAFLDVALPDANSYGLENLRISLDGATVTGTTAPEKNLVRIPFSFAWPIKKKISLNISYDLTARSHPENELAVLDDSFYLSTTPWYPVPQPPDAHISSGGAFTDDYDVTIRVPEGFLVHAAGRNQGSKRQGAHRLHRFTISNDDFDPFVVSGRYSEQRFTASGFPIIFWTRQPLPPANLQAAATRLGKSVATFESLFGPCYHPSAPVWVVNPPTEIIHSQPIDDVPSSYGLPQSVLFHPIGSREGKPFGWVSAAETIETTLASSWVKHLSSPAGSVESRLADAISVYASLLAKEASGEKGALEDFVRATFFAYEANLDQIQRADSTFKTPTLLTAAAGSSESDQLLSTLEAVLLPSALENHVGRAHFRAALRRMIQARRGRDWSINDFRSALEAESGQSLADFFRLWLNEPGIPADFRARYSQP